MKRILLFVVSFIVFMTNCTFASEGSVYEDRFHNTFRITLPDDWQISNFHGTLFAATSPSSSTIKVYISLGYTEIEPSEEEIDRFADFLIENAGMLEDKHSIMIDNRNAIRFITVDNNKSVYKVTYLFYKKGVIVRVEGDGNLSQLDEDQKSFDQIMSTFEFLF